MNGFRTALSFPILIPATILWIMGLFLIVAAGIVAGHPEWAYVALGKK